MDRALAGTRPFTKDGKLGYRDALIWHNVLNEARSQEAVVFVTNDTDFLSDSEPAGLHPDLEKDLSAAGIDAGRVTVAQSIAAAVEKIVDPAQGVIEKLGSKLADDADWRERLISSTIEVAEDEAPYADATSLDVGIGVEVEALGVEEVESELDYLDHFSRIAIVDALPLSEERFGVELWMDCTAFFDVTLSTWNMSAPDGVPGTLSLAADERTGSTGGFTETRLVFEATLEADGSLSPPRLVRMQEATELDRDSELSRFRFRSRKRPRQIRWAEIPRN